METTLLTDLARHCRWGSKRWTSISENQGKTLTVVQPWDHRKHFAGKSPEREERQRQDSGAFL